VFLDYADYFCRADFKITANLAICNIAECVRHSLIEIFYGLGWLMFKMIPFPQFNRVLICRDIAT